MNKQAIQHQPESKFCFAISKNKIKIRLQVSNDDVFDKVNIVYGGKYDFYTYQNVEQMSLTYKTSLFNVYEITLNLKDVRLVYIFEIYENNKKYYFSEDGVTTSYDFSKSFYNCFQYSYINKNDIIYPIKWLNKAIFYQIFIDRFNIGDTKKDMSYINLKWGKKPNPKSFAGGDLRGIIDKLSYIKNIGFNTIYLTPIFKSISNHKYDIQDYYEVDKQFGSASDLKELIDKAHAKGMKIVLDAVFNHCSDKLEEFQDALKNKEESKYYDWFIFKGKSYETFAACKYMPKFNTANKQVQNYLINIARYYIEEFDIDGWRLDVSDEISHEFWKKFRIAVKSLKPDCVIIGENWHSAESFLKGDEFDSIMNYGFTKACLDFYAFKKYDASAMADRLNELFLRNIDATSQMMLNLLDSHDTLRFLTEVKEDKDKLHSALALLFVYCGVPCVYYGTEIDMIGGYDPDSRRTYNWNYKNHDTINLIKALSSLKRQGYLSGPNIEIKSDNELLIINRTTNKGTIKLVINNSNINIGYVSTNTIYKNKYNGEEILSNGFLIELIKE